VNTGRYVGKRDLEETVLKTNLEAVKEVVNQLRFRNIGGLIIVDLIDMESAGNRDKVYRAFQEALRQDKAKTNILKISELGLVEMTRKRTRENLVQMLCEPCGHCEGRGYVLSPESVAYKVLREIRKDLPRFCGREIAVTVNPDVEAVLLGPAHQARADLIAQLGRNVEIRARPGLHQEQFEVTALDEGPPVDLPLGWLSDERPGTEADDAVAPEVAGAAVAEAVPASLAETPAAEAAPETPVPHGEIALVAEQTEIEPVETAPEKPLPPAPPAGEMLDVEAESPILPGSTEREES